ncbi:hypothetical protein Asi03nite_70320 [Actinoplanes siamensis]|uniref:Uncharacterized protein n=1 Tax=Actinoplanes siamensis TaxID=1223317 RepID=A0A919NF03_9ACTN|nr:hypothetical protein Asi03nite_70320 [Actinoplanes siamensis]
MGSAGGPEGGAGLRLDGGAEPGPAGAELAPGGAELAPGGAGTVTRMVPEATLPSASTIS